MLFYVTSDSTWNNMTEASDNVRLYLTIYGGISAANSLFTFIRAFLFAYGGITAAINIHNRLLSRILKVRVYCLKMELIFTSIPVIVVIFCQTTE